MPAVNLYLSKSLYLSKKLKTYITLLKEDKNHDISIWGFYFLHSRLLCRSNMTETEIKVDASTIPVEKKEKPDQKQKSPRGGRAGDKEGLDEAALEREFKNFAIKLRKQFGEDCLAYQVSNYPEVS